MSPLPDGLPTDRLAMPLRHLAHGRSGDKGNRSNISVIAWDAAFWPLLVEQVTVDAVAQRFATRRPTAVVRYLLPALHAMNFVLDGVLDGGVNDALNLDTHGKALSFLVLDLAVQVPRELASRLVGLPARGGAAASPRSVQETR